MEIVPSNTSMALGCVGRYLVEIMIVQYSLATFVGTVVS
jgi:hypothetical protein